MRRPARHARRGAMIVLIAIMLVAFLVTIVFSVDIAYMQLTRTELRTATDAASRAAAESLSRLQSEDAARDAAKTVAALNTVAGQPLLLADEDIVFGKSQRQPGGAWVFTPGASPSNAVMIHGRRTEGSLSGPVPLFLAGMLGRDTFEPIQEATASQLDRDICIVMDRSGSMAWDLSGTSGSYPPGGSQCVAPHPTLSRWAAAAAALNAFLNEMNQTPQNEQVALVTYASAGTWCSKSYSAATLEIALTTDMAAVSSAVAARGSKAIPGATSISAGIDRGILALTNPATARPHAVKTMIVLTDGIHNSGPAPISSANAAAANEITIHTITFSDGADQAQMQDVAAAADGNHYHAPDAASLIAIFQEIASTLPVILTE